ncbi:MAG: hypothetical protein ACKO80_06655 [Acidimicrobiaceae bacterium]
MGLVAKNVLLLGRLNRVVLGVAIVVYVGILAIAVTEKVLPLAVFSTCIMLAELLVFQIVRTLCGFIDSKMGSS